MFCLYHPNSACRVALKWSVWNNQFPQNNSYGHSSSSVISMTTWVGLKTRMRSFKHLNCESDTWHKIREKTWTSRFGKTFSKKYPNKCWEPLVPPAGPGDRAAAGRLPEPQRCLPAESRPLRGQGPGLQSRPVPKTDKFVFSLKFGLWHRIPTTNQILNWNSWFSQDKSYWVTSIAKCLDLCNWCQNWWCSWTVKHLVKKNNKGVCLLNSSEIFWKCWSKQNWLLEGKAENFLFPVRISSISPATSSSSVPKDIPDKKFTENSRLQRWTSKCSGRAEIDFLLIYWWIRGVQAGSIEPGVKGSSLPDRSQGQVEHAQSRDLQEPPHHASCAFTAEMRRIKNTNIGPLILGNILGKKILENSLELTQCFSRLKLPLKIVWKFTGIETMFFQGWNCHWNSETFVPQKLLHKSTVFCVLCWIWGGIWGGNSFGGSQEILGHSISCVDPGSLIQVQWGFLLRCCSCWHMEPTWGPRHAGNQHSACGWNIVMRIENWGPSCWFLGLAHELLVSVHVSSSKWKFSQKMYVRPNSESKLVVSPNFPCCKVVSPWIQWRRKYQHKLHQLDSAVIRSYLRTSWQKPPQPLKEMDFKLKTFSMNDPSQLITSCKNSSSQ